LKKIKYIALIAFVLAIFIPEVVYATNDLNINVSTPGGELDTVGLLVFLTILSFLPSLILTMTSFTRIIVVFSFIRNAIGTQNIPPNQVLIGLALIISFFTFAPTYDAIVEEAYEPYTNEELTVDEALDIGAMHVKKYMLKYTEDSAIETMYKMSGDDVTYDTYEDIPITTVAPAFVISELKTAFKIGFLLYVPFLVVDLVIASILMSMGMFMMPPSQIAIPFKILLFVLVDGWSLIIESLLSGLS
jgi:flagellar biosynthetic protein FliP